MTRHAAIIHAFIARCRRTALVLAGCCVVLGQALPSESVEVLVVGDTQLTPVIEIISGIRETLGVPFEVYDAAQVRGKLRNIVAKEQATVIIALGKDAIDETVHIPPSVAVIYDLVVKPPALERPNTTGFYMATPVREYVEVVNRYLPALRWIAVVGSPDLMSVVEGPRNQQVTSYRVTNPVELVSTVAQLDEVDAFLLLPDVALLTASAVEDVYLQSFKKGIPILGVSERNVKQGALMALVFDATRVGRQIGEKASSAVRGEDMGRIPPSPSREFDLFLNLDTAKRMGIDVPAELIRRAKRVYP